MVRGVIVSHETVPQWALECGQGFATPDPVEAALRRRQMAPG
jgi:transposase-like protein